MDSFLAWKTLTEMTPRLTLRAGSVIVTVRGKGQLQRKRLQKVHLFFVFNKRGQVTVACGDSSKHDFPVPGMDPLRRTKLTVTGNTFALKMNNECACMCWKTN